MSAYVPALPFTEPLTPETPAYVPAVSLPTPAAPALPRHFLRCPDCLEVMAVDVARLPWEFSQVQYTCGYCGRTGLDHMGRVQIDRLVKDRSRCACDDRCTSARGPICVCHCAGKNHGAGILARIYYTEDQGKVPTLKPANDNRRARAVKTAAEYLDALTKIRDAFLPLVDRRAKGEFLPRADWDRMTALQFKYRKAIAAKTHAARMKALTF